MGFLPIIERELRLAARKKGTHWLRFFAALVVIALFFLLLAGNSGRFGNRQLGSVLFYSSSLLAFGFALVAGVFLTSDCLCSERRDGTLGLLFLTDLRGYDVVLGKLAATSMVSAYALMGIIPVLGVPLLMGGVSGGEFARMVLVLLVTLLVSLATGMLASAVCRETRSAMLLSFGFLVGLTGGMYLIALIAGRLLGFPASGWLLSLSPLLAFNRTGDVWHQLGQGATQYWTSISMLFLQAIAFLSLASLWLPRSWREEGVERGSSASAKPSRAIPRTRHYSAALSVSPFGWLAGRDSFPGPWLKLFFATVFIVWLGFVLHAFFIGTRNAAESFITAFFIAFGLHLVVKGLMAVQATRRLCEDRRSGALELLLATPLNPAEIVSGQWSALRQQFRWLLWALTFINLGLVATALLSQPASMSMEIAWTFSAFFLGGIVLLWIDFRAIGWLGMWTAMRGVRPLRAVLNTTARILLPPWLAIFAFVALGFSGGFSPETVTVCWLVWVSLCIISAQMAVALRKRQLVEDFRRMAAGEPLHIAPDDLQPWSPEWESGPSATTAPQHDSTEAPLR